MNWLDTANPTPRKMYVITPLGVGAGCAIAAGCMAYLAALPVIHWAGLGFGAGMATGLLAAVNAIPQERRAWYELCKTREIPWTAPPVVPEPEPPRLPDMLMIPDLGGYSGSFVHFESVTDESIYKLASRVVRGKTSLAVNQLEKARVMKRPERERFVGELLRRDLAVMGQNNEVILNHKGKAVLREIYRAAMEAAPLPHRNRNPRI